MSGKWSGPSGDTDVYRCRGTAHASSSGEASVYKRVTLAARFVVHADTVQRGVGHSVRWRQAGSLPIGSVIPTRQSAAGNGAPKYWVTREIRSPDSSRTEQIRQIPVSPP